MACHFNGLCDYWRIAAKDKLILKNGCHATEAAGYNPFIVTGRKKKKKNSWKMGFAWSLQAHPLEDEIINSLETHILFLWLLKKLKWLSKIATYYIYIVGAKQFDTIVEIVLVWNACLIKLH